MRPNGARRISLTAQRHDQYGQSNERVRNKTSKSGFTCTLWRGERMNLIGFDVAHPEPDLVGFSIKVKAPDAMDFTPLGNRMAFSYPKGAANEVTGDRTFPSLQRRFRNSAGCSATRAGSAPGKSLT